MSSNQKTMTAGQFKAAALTEEDVQRSIIQWCHLHGYLVMQTSRRGITCHTCKKRVYGADGVTKGLPDLFIRHPDWDIARWIAVEVKGPRTRVSEEQFALAVRGDIIIVRSLDEFVKLIGGVVVL